MFEAHGHHSKQQDYTISKPEEIERLEYETKRKAEAEQTRFLNIYNWV